MPEVYNSHTKPKKSIIKEQKVREKRLDAILSDKSLEFKKKSKNPLTAFGYFPRKADFETKDKEEHVILLLRKHPITNARWIIASLILIMLPTVILFLPTINAIPERFMVVGILGWYMFILAYIIENFLSWFFNVNIITDERIVDIDFHNLVYKEISDAKLDRIQDVTLQMGGAIRLFFNFGDVIVQTAAETPNIDFHAIPNPDKVVKILQDLLLEEEQEKLDGRVR